MILLHEYLKPYWIYDWMMPLGTIQMPDKYFSSTSLITRGVSDLFPSSSSDDPEQNFDLRLRESIKSKKPLRIKLGIDPTGSEIHLGHSILFRKLRAFQNAGHTAILIIGDFTARIGDPTGKNNTRPPLSAEQVESNAQTYLEQLGYEQPPEKSILDFTTPGRLEIKRNSEWLGNLDLTDVIELLTNATVGQMLAKDDFGKRYSTGTSISLHEFLYPLLQGYDSVAVRADVELGGTDQKFNVGIGRDLQRYFNQKPQFGMLLPILVGLDGVQKMSKSLANTVGINEDAISMYSKLEKLPDELVMDYLTLLTDLDLDDLNLNQRDIQKRMALEVTATRHGIEAAHSAQNNALKLVSGINHSVRDIPEVSISNVNFPAKLFYLISVIGLISSSSEAIRQIKGGAVRLEGQKIFDPNHRFCDASELIGKIIQIGKKTFRRLVK